MRGVDGFAVLGELRNNPITSNIPVIFVSSFVEKKEIESGLGCGAHAYLKKPFTEQELTDSISLCADFNKMRLR